MGKRLLKKKIRLIDILEVIFILGILTFASWLYILPVIDTPGIFVLFSDDAIYALSARRVLDLGFPGAFHLTWAPLFPWLMAFLQKFLNIPIEDGGRLITAFSLVLRIVPIYLLTKMAFNKLTAIITSLFVVFTPMILIPVETSLAEGLYSFLTFTGLCLAFFALKTKKLIYYLLTGTVFGLVYLTRLEGWLYMPALAVCTASGLFLKKLRVKSLKLLFILFASFLIISSPYIVYTHEVFGSWTLNPRVGLTFMDPGNHFKPLQDNFGLTTLAQIYFSWNPYYYQSKLWHPEPIDFWLAVARSWPLIPTVPKLYFNFFQTSLPILFPLSLLGIFLALASAFRKRLKLLFPITLTLLLVYSFLSLLFQNLEFLNFAKGKDFSEAFLDIIYRRFVRFYKPELVFLLAGIIFLPIILIRDKTIYKLPKFINEKSLLFFLPLALITGNLPLMFHTFSGQYTSVLGPILLIFGTFFISLVLRNIYLYLLKSTDTRTRLILLPCLAMAATLLILNIITPLIHKSLAGRSAQYEKMNDRIGMYKLPGEVILKDHGPGARVGVFHEAAAFYAKGEPFYIMTDPQTSLEQTLTYLSDNKVDYIVALREQAYSCCKSLRPLIDPKTDLSGWKMIYIDPPASSNPVITDTRSDVLVAVWKRI